MSQWTVYLDYFIIYEKKKDGGTVLGNSWFTAPNQMTDTVGHMKTEYDGDLIFKD
jgi:hypothetical protein